MKTCEKCLEIGKAIKWQSGELTEKLREINKFVSSKMLVEVGQVFPGGHSLIVRYQCMECGSLWRLTYPDHAFPGGFSRE